MSEPETEYDHYWKSQSLDEGFDDLMEDEYRAEECEIFWILLLIFICVASLVFGVVGVFWFLAFLVS